MPVHTIKNMVCPRCIHAVQQIYHDLGLSAETVSLGEVRISKPLTTQEQQLLEERLQQQGFVLLTDKPSQIINNIKSIIIHEIHYRQEPSLHNLSSLLTRKLPYGYSHLSRLFSTVEGQTIEKYTMLQKIERVKELISYGEQSLTEVAYQMQYSSVAHLSTQFKKVTGMTPSAFKKLQQQERTFLDAL